MPVNAVVKVSTILAPIAILLSLDFIAFAKG
jgi:hypothetical protein